MDNQVDGSRARGHTRAVATFLDELVPQPLYGEDHERGDLAW